MNKLSALMAEKTGKESKYQEIKNATYGTVEEQQPLGANTAPYMTRMSSSNISNEKRTIFVYLCQNIAWVIIIVLLTIIFALAGERASSLQESADLVESTAKASSIKWRPCQIYTDATEDSVKILQTSIGDPSNQWGEIPCLVRKNHKLPYSKIYDDPQWNWLFGSDENTKTPIEYGSPSAVIKTDFSNIAHPKRKPILGFGGAFTEASSLNFMSLEKPGRDAVLELLFGSTGLGYSLGRVPINSCDFSVESYNFDNVEDDFELEHFDMKVSHDVESGMVELLLHASKTLNDAWSGDKLNVMASPWSPPAWMKKATKADPEGSEHAVNMTGSAVPNCLRDGTGKESKYAAAWALYFTKFISAYKAWGVDLFGVTVQNEPEFPAPWEACAYNPSIEADFIANHLGPTLQRYHPDVNLLIFDHNKDHAVKWGKQILNKHNPASKYVNGTAIHWYAGGMDRLLDGAVGQPNVHRYASMLKYQNVSDDHILLGSEACHCPSTGYAGGDLNVAWARAERYAHTILADLAAGSQGWVEWNLILDSIGGPNHLGNMCDAPILAVPYRIGKHNVSELPVFEHADYPFGPVVGDTRTREELNALGMPAEYVDKGLIVQPMYYYMGHISRHVRPGSRAVYALVDQSEFGRAFKQSDGTNVIAGGGVNDLARVGVELTFWPCEGSTRQAWTFVDNQLQVYGHSWLGAPTKSCVGKEVDVSFKGLLLSTCNDEAAIFDIVPLNATLGTSQILFNNTDATAGQNCLSLLPLENGGGAYGPRGGSQATIGSCDDENAVWKFNATSGELISNLYSESGGEVCLTTGWPYLQSGAFIDKDGENKTVIVLNEASDSANYVLRGDDGEILITNSIPAHSIQTILL